MTTSKMQPFGFHNLGATCYFNALVQSLLSCPSFTKELMRDDKYKNNPISSTFIELIETSTYYNDLCEKNNDPDPEIVATASETKHKLNKFGAKIWKKMIVKLSSEKKIKPQSFMQGMQCAGEGYHYLLESMEKFQALQNLFLHRYKSLIHCFTCDDWVSNVNCLYSLFEVDPHFQTEQLDKFKDYHINPINMNEFISKQSGYVDKDFQCSKCKTREERFRVNLLVMVPEILVVMAKKFTVEQKLDVNTDFPTHMQFNGSKNKPMIYEAVAQIEHTGGRDGGHYWAICKRRGGWFELNDMNVLPSKFQPTKNTYIVMYNLVS
jgi:ubiquitin C-terminal hydrolase